MGLIAVPGRERSPRGQRSWRYGSHSAVVPEDHASRERLFTGAEGNLTVALAVGWGVLLLGRSAVPPVLPHASATIGLTPESTGLALTAMMATHSLLQYPGGRLSDELSRATLLVGSLFAASVGFGLLLRARTYPGLVLGMATVGSGTGLYFSPGRALLSDLYDERLGQALGLQTMAGLVASGLAGGLVTVVVARTDWQYTFALPLVGVVLLIGGLHLLRTEPYELGMVSLDVAPTARRLVGRADVRRLLSVTTARSLVNQSIIGFLPLYLLEARNFSSAMANGSYALLFFVGAVVGPFAGRVGDRFPRKRVLVGLLATSAAGVAVIVAAGAPSVAIAGVVLFSIGIWGFPPVMQSELLSRFAAGSVGGDFGALKLVYTGLGSIGPTVFGVIVAAAGYTVGLVVCVAGLLIGAGLMATVPD